ncbi:sugar translocase [Priestia megaterium]|uniref:lipopolysaccharide biosynthesis protein n=1 Tax=Priestia megaterium TaxID=1404 RepID=UPI000BF2C53E|nr:oligosaccharide flippase family protein [Priestia megaterium]MED4618003.1 oligosaccharide flippase family protein [Priestia megaterium]PEZ45473.1 sugar translocase [Priestia megaterium]
MLASNSRTKKTITNVSFAFLGHFSNQIMTFVVRTVFINTLAIKYLGINGLFTNILAFLSLAELGVASAMIYSMYTPIAEKNYKKIHVYMTLYKKLYTIIGVSILLIGCSLIPFLNFFFKERPNISYLEFIYFLYVLNSASTYFFSYKGSIFRADQRQYIVTNNNTVFTFIQSIARILVLLLFKDFILYLFISIICVFVQNFVLSRKADKAYPFLKKKSVDKLSKQEERNLMKNIGAMFFQKLGSVVLNASDNIILSKFAGVVFVGLYSNYALIIGIIKSVFNTISDGIIPSVGNLCATGSKEQSEKIFNALLLLNVWGMGFCSICLFVLLNPFIELWIGKDYVLNIYVVLFSVISLYIQMTMRAAEMIKNATGLFWNDRYVPFIQCIINIVVSIILVQKFGVSGIFIGTSLAMLLTSFWVTPYIIYKHYFKKPLYHYFLRLSLYTIVIILSGALTVWASGYLLGNKYINFIFKMACCCLIPNIVCISVFGRSTPFKTILNLLGVKRVLKRQVNC